MELQFVILLAVLWIVGAIFYFKNRDNNNKGKQVNYKDNLPVSQTKNAILIKIDFNLSPEDSTTLKADMVLKMKDLISGNYKIPEKLKSKFIQESEKKEKKIKTRKPKENKEVKLNSETYKNDIPGETPYIKVTNKNDPEASVDLSTVPDKNWESEIVSMLMEQSEEKENIIEDFLNENKFVKNTTSDASGNASVTDYDSLF